MSCCFGEQFCKKFFKIFHIRVVMVLNMVMIKLLTFLILMASAIKQKPEDIYLYSSAFQSLISFASLGLFIGSWSETWPEVDGKSKAEPTTAGKWQFLMYMASVQQGMIMVALMASDSLDGFDARFLFILLAEFVGQMHGLIAVMDYISPKRNFNYVIDTLCFVATKSNDE